MRQRDPCPDPREQPVTPHVGAPSRPPLSPLRPLPLGAVNANIAARLAERAERHPDRLAIAEARGGSKRRATFGELAERVAALAAGLEDRGVSAGDRVLLFVPMSIDLYVALLAVLHLGAVAVFVDAWAGRRRLDD